MESQQVVLLVGVQIKLPGARLLLVRGANGRAGVDHQVAGIRCGDGDVKKAHRRGISELLVGDQLKHRRRLGHERSH